MITGGSGPDFECLLRCSTVARNEFLRISVRIYSRWTGTYLNHDQLALHSSEKNSILLTEKSHPCVRQLR